MSSAWPPVPATIWPSRSTCIVCTRCCACGCRTGSASDHAAHAAQRPRYRTEDADRSDLSEVQLRLPRLHGRLAKAPRAARHARDGLRHRVGLQAKVMHETTAFSELLQFLTI